MIFDGFLEKYDRMLFLRRHNAEEVKQRFSRTLVVAILYKFSTPRRHFDFVLLS